MCLLWIEAADWPKGARARRTRMLKSWSSVLVLALAGCVGLSSALADDAPKKKEGKKKPSAEQIVKKLDANEDGKLSVEELVKSPRIKDEARAKKMVERMDADKDGAISAEEFKKAFKKHRGPHRRHHKKGDGKKREGKRPSAEQIIKKLDANGDGKLSAEEWAKSPRAKDPERAKKMFEKIDANKDGAVCPVELKKAFEKRRGHHRHHKGKGDKKECGAKKECPAKEKDKAEKDSAKKESEEKK